MRTKGFSIGIIFLLIAVVCTTCTKDEALLIPDGELSALKKANSSNYVPGEDITEQLRSDLENGLSVTLPAGHFYLSESVFITGYTGGTIKGAGKGFTIIEASPGFKALPNPFIGGETASILEFHWATGDITLKAMSVMVEGETPAEEHVHLFLGTSTNIDNIFVVQGRNISVEYKDLSFKGEFVGDEVPGAVNGYNVGIPMLTSGWQAEGGPINLTIKNCEVDGAGEFGMDYLVGNGVAEFKDNDISNAHVGLRLAILWDGNVTVKDCRFENITADVILEYGYIGIPLCFKDNMEDGLPLPDDCQ